MNKSNSIKQGITIIFGVNILSMLFSLIMNFALPKWLSINTYSSIQTYNLYVGYSGLFTLGFTDGIYLKYGGKDLIDINREELKADLSTFRIFQMILIFIGIFLWKFTGDIIVLFAGVALFPLNMTSFFTLLFQATGEFGEYSKITGLKAVALFCINIVLLLIIRSDNVIFYLISYLILNFGYWIILEEKFLNKGEKIILNKFDFFSLLSNIKNGLPLTLGTFTSTVFTSIDRWFIKAWLDSTVFAYYSFAVSIDNMLNTAISPITITLYNYFCNNREEQNIRRIRRYIIIFVSLLASSAFVAKFIIENFIAKYKSSIPILFFLISGKILYVIIQAIYVNLYKALKKQKIYFISLILVTVINVVANAILFIFIKNSIAFAIGTAFSNLAWLGFCMFEFYPYRLSLREILYLLGIIVVLIICGLRLSAIAGFLIYITWTIGFTVLLFKVETWELIHQMLNFLKRK